MHVAVCDDNVADRKQTERLLDRASDKRAATSGVLYSDSFGNPDVMLTHPMLYDVFFLDICHTEGLTALSVTEQLRAKGVDAPIVLCSSDIDYEQQPFPEGTLFLKKPLTQAALIEMLDHAQAIKDSAEHRIEIRYEKQTHYVRECEILYAESNGNNTDVHMADGTLLKATVNISTFFDDLEVHHPSFVMPNTRQLVNCRYIVKFSFLGKATLTDGTQISFGRAFLPYGRAMQAEYYGKDPDAK